MISLLKLFDVENSGQEGAYPSLNRKGQLFTFCLLFFTALIVYARAYDVRIPTDSFLFLQTFEALGAEGLLHNFYDIGLAPVADFFLFLLYKLFGPNTLGWFMTAMLLHALNAYLIILISLRLYASFSLKAQFLPALFAALLFLLSPYQTEVLLWTPRIINYIVAVTFILLACLYLLKYSQKEKPADLFLLHLFFLLATLSFETTLSFPAVPVCFVVLYRLLHRKPLRPGTIFLYLILPQASLIFLYFLTCKLWLGEWILHYGAEAHLNFSISLAMGTLIKYLAKFFLYYRYLPDSRHELLHDVLHTDISNDRTMWVLAALAILLTAFLFYRSFRNNKELTLLLGFLASGFVITLIPVLNLDTSFLGAVFTDRYGYLPSVFFYLLLTGCLIMLFKKNLIIICSGILLLHVVLLVRTIPVWNEASDYSKRLINNFVPYMDEPNIMVLNMPDNYHWIMTYRNGFAAVSEFAYDKKLKQLDEVAGFHMTSLQDSVNVHYDGLRTIRVESAPNRRSFLYRGRWGKSFETNLYTVAFDKGLTSYTLTFKEEIPADLSIFYAAGDQWRKLKLK